MPKARWSEVLQQYNSVSAPEKLYSVKQNLDTGQLGCDCPSWRFKRTTEGEARECKHTINYRTQVMPAIERAQTHTGRHTLKRGPALADALDTAAKAVKSDAWAESGFGRALDTEGAEVAVDAAPPMFFPRVITLD